jgi:hypothetical protein
VTGSAPTGTTSEAAAIRSAGTPGAGCLCWKHWRQSTGRPCVGLKGTVVSTPHSEHWVRVSVRESPAEGGLAPGRKDAMPARLNLHGLQRFGSFLNCLSKKKSCSPAVKMNSPPQSAQVKILSTNSIAASPVLRKKGEIPVGIGYCEADGRSTLFVISRCRMYRARCYYVFERINVLQSREPLHRLSLLEYQFNGGSPSTGGVVVSSGRPQLSAGTA